MSLQQHDPEIAAIIDREQARQAGGIELIASENWVSHDVLEATGTVLTNKYAEGYPGKRYYGGCVHVDEAEELARERAKQLFGAEYINVQPHSGSSANFEVFAALLQPGDTYMGLSLSHGGHLTHGSPYNFSGKLYNCVPYEVDPATGRFDYEAVAAAAQEHQPKMILVGYTLHPWIIDWAKWREIADSVGAYLFADIAHIAGLVASGQHPSPFPHAHVVSTTTHKTLRGPRGGMIMTNDEELATKLNKAVFPGSQGGPLMHVIAAKAVAFQEALQPEFKDYASRVVANAKVLAAALQEEGFALVGGGTETHLMWVDLRPFKVTGKVAEEELDKVGITLNKNTIPDDPESPFVTSGVRIGTPAVTTRGMGEDDMRVIAKLIAQTLRNIGDEAVYDEVRVGIAALTKAHPLP